MRVKGFGVAIACGVLSAAFLAGACGKAKNKADPAESPSGVGGETSTEEATSTETSTSTATSTGTGTSTQTFGANLSPSSILGVLDNAVGSSVGSLALDLAGAGLHLLDGESDEAASTDDARCGTKGSPWDAQTNAPLLPSNPLFAARTIHCKLGFDSGSPETARGAYGIAKGILCAIDKSGPLEYTAAGTTEERSVPITTDCFSEAFANDPENKDQVFQMPITAKQLPATAKWDRMISFPAPGGDDGEVLEIYFRNEGSMVAVAASEGWAFSLNADSGTLRFESLSSRHGRHTRLLAKGAFDVATGTFSAVEQLEGIHSDGPNAVTLKGSPTSGLRGRLWTRPSAAGEGEADVDFADYTEQTARCYGAAGATCAGNAGIAIESDAFLDVPETAAAKLLLAPLAFGAVEAVAP